MNYNELTQRFFEDDAAVGMFDGPRAYRGAAGSHMQGTWVQFDVLLEPVAERIAAVCFQAFGCPHVIAIAAWIAAQARGSSVRVGPFDSVHSLRERFAVPIEKLGRLLIVEDAWTAAMREASRRDAA